MIEAILYMILGVFLYFSFNGFMLDWRDTVAAAKQKEEDDKEFLIWVSRNVEWGVDDDDNWDFEISPANPNYVHVKTAQELREFWEKNVKQ